MPQPCATMQSSFSQMLTWMGRTFVLCSSPSSSAIRCTCLGLPGPSPVCCCAHLSCLAGKSYGVRLLGITCGGVPPEHGHLACAVSFRPLA